MRLFYKYTISGSLDENHIEVVTAADGKSEIQQRTPVADVHTLTGSGDAVLYNSLGELRAVVQYATDRRNNYPAIEEQLDSLYHEIIVSGSLTSSGSWAQSIRAVKDAHPKP
jgi:hypothetical protein